jgi:uncharacterized RDD family membrane protein YckC
MNEGINITTAQNVTLNYNIGSLGDRIVAAIIDNLIKAAYFMVIYFIIIGAILGEFFAGAAIGAILFLPVMFYSLFFEIYWNGQTPGKKAMNLQVVSMDGNQATMSQYLVRWLMRIVDFAILSGLIALIVAAVSEKTQRVGDIVANTLVISTKNKVGLHQTVHEDITESYEPMYLEAMNLSGNDAAIIKDVLIARVKGADEQIVIQTADKVAQSLDVEYLEPPAKFLKTVLRDYNHFQKNLPM